MTAGNRLLLGQTPLLREVPHAGTPVGGVYPALTLTQTGTLLFPSPHFPICERDRKQPHCKERPCSHHIPWPQLPDTCLLVRAVFNRRARVPSGRKREGCGPGAGGRGAPHSARQLSGVLHRVGVGPLKICANSRCGGIRQSEFFRHQPRVCGAPKCHKGAAWATFLSP